MEKLYRVKEAKELLRVTTRTIQRWDEEGEVRVVRIVCGRRRIPEERGKAYSGIEGGKSCLGIC